MTNHVLSIGNLNQIGTQIGDVQKLIPGIIQNLPPELAANISSLITILKALGIIFIIYLVFLIINIILNIRRNFIIRTIYKKVNEIDRKLDIVLHKPAKEKEHKEKYHKNK